MIVDTKYSGELEIEETEIIFFKTGLPGFQEETKFLLIDFPDNPVFQILQSVQTPTTAFIVTNPYYIYQDYEFDLDENIMEQLNIRSEKEIVVLSIVTVKEPFQDSTLNLKAPIILNPVRKLAKQYILTEETYQIKTPLNPNATMGGR
ncbi:flagellar assembly protein FliW [Virgibacillus halodenitrificans]|uniref:flagellar assembly protein FliW n=1 Tax=Virgibacillus halodenitrificans TaxID=1482 RepID=UPI0007610FF2